MKNGRRAIATPSMRQAPREHAGLRGLGAEGICQVLHASMPVWRAHAWAWTQLLGTMTWALQELRLHHQAERKGVPRATLN